MPPPFLHIKFSSEVLRRTASSALLSEEKNVPDNV
jgi:hypothetical protein